MAAVGRAAARGPRPAVLSHPALRADRRHRHSYFTWRSAARSRAQRLAAAFSLSLVLFYWFGWEIHHSVSHSLALLAASLALFIAALAYAERPTAARAHFLLGLIIGIGLMAKWSFLLVVLSLGVALALTPETRRIYRDPRTLLVLIGAALPILPFLLWLATSRSGPRRPPRRAAGERLVGGAGAARRARLHHRHPARVPPVDRLRAVLRLALPEDAAGIAATAAGGGDQPREPHRDHRRSR